MALRCQSTLKITILRFPLRVRITTPPAPPCARNPLMTRLSDSHTLCAMTEGELLLRLRSVLPFLSQVTGGYATVTDRQGRRLYTVDAEGSDLPELKDSYFQPGEQLLECGIAGSDIVSGAQSWVLPLGPYVLACSNIERVKRSNDLFDNLRQALPFIARLVGGEAVLFDREGRRLVSYGHNGAENTARVGRISQAAGEAMRTNKPTIGPSTSVDGAVAVRFPVTSTFGFGFNNEQSVLREKNLLKEVRKGGQARYSFIDIEGESRAIAAVRDFARQLAAGDSSLLIYGETGTGKELFAQSIHNESRRRSKPFIAINCGALPASLIESNLFGYEGGAFTGASRSGSQGIFEQAKGGTVFLDEVSEMDFVLQSKILRVLQEREVVRLGSSKVVSVDIRVLAATNKNLADMVSAGTFRDDLFYRLNVVQLAIPPVRSRKEDIPVLVRSFINRNNQLFGKFVFSVSPEVQAILQRHDWPGNVRELQNCIEYAFNILSPKEQEIFPQHLPHYLREFSGSSRSTHFPRREEGPAEPDSVPHLEESVRAAERRAILHALEVCGQNRTLAARRLGVSSPTLWRKMKALGVS